GHAVEIVGGDHAGHQARHPDRVAPGREVGEAVEAVVVRGGGGDDGAAGEELDGKTGEAGLAGILDAVTVGVEPDAVAGGADETVSEINVRAGLSGGEGEGSRIGGCDTVEVVGLHEGPGGKRGADDRHSVGTAGQVTEGVVAVAA